MLCICHCCVFANAAIAVCLLMQEKKKAEADKQKELNDLFAIAIKQPKVPPGQWPCINAPLVFAFTAIPSVVCWLPEVKQATSVLCG